MATNQYLLHESAAGYALFQKVEGEAIAQDAEASKAAAAKFETFKGMMKLVGMQKFVHAEEALAECNAVASGEVTALLSSFLELNLPKSKKSSTYNLGVYDPDIGRNLSAKGFSVNTSHAIKELLRGCLIHFPRFAKDVTEEVLNKARCGLAHCFSRNRMQLDPNRQDKPIMNVIAILDNLDKNINTFAMRVREWYSWHFPELAKICSDNIVFAKCARLIRLRDNFDFLNRKHELVECLGGSEELAEEIIKAMQISMGQDIVEMDMANIDNFALQVIELANMRTLLNAYLKNKMDIVAPNLGALIGEHVGARLLSHAGSLTSLAKYPASTVQILGAEKALFRALKTKGNTPKYGLLYHSTFIGRAQAKNKGRISRYLANKCSIASRIDCFSDHTTKIYGERMRQQVEDRLTFLTEGVKPAKNLDVMRQALEAVEEEKAACGVGAKIPAPSAGPDAGAGAEGKKKKKKRSACEAAEPTEPVAEPLKKKKKKTETAVEAPAEAATTEPVAEPEKKKKSKKQKLP